MSDTMMFDIARMPYEMAMSDEMSRRQFYANTQSLAAALEALRAEVKMLTFEMGLLRQQYDERTACTIVHRGAALACSDAVRAAYYEEYERAKRLEAALRQLLGACEDSCDFADPQGRGTLREVDAMDRAYKALEQESKE